MAYALTPLVPASIFEDATGRIVLMCSDWEVAQINCGAGQAVVKGSWENTLYYIEVTRSGPEVRERPMLPTGPVTIRPDGIDAVSFGVPAGTAVIFEGVRTVIRDNKFKFTSPVPGTFSIAFEPPFPWRSSVLEVIVD